jgi:hypothetical protein
VPVPKQQYERSVNVVVFRRMPWLFRSFRRMRALVDAKWMSEAELADEFIDQHR